jgi:drug/metabolite transporter (DMT)-like permease
MRVFFGQPLSARLGVAAVLGVGGVALLFLPELGRIREGGAIAAGIGYALAATALATGGNLVAVRNHRAGLSLFPATAWGMLYGALVAAAVAALLGDAWTFDARAPYVLSLLYLAVFGSIVAFGAYLTLLGRIGAGRSSYVGVSTPVVAMLLTTLFEGYVWTGTAALGVALAVAGNVVTLRAPRSRG